jgi:hypothetical protein
LLDVRDGLAPPESEAGPIEERYLRVALSSVARAATIQEVAFEQTREGDQIVVRESPRPGVFDPILLKRLQRAVDLLEASDVEHLDFGLLDRPADGMQAGDYHERYGTDPLLVNFLFYAQPSATASASYLLAGDEAGIPPGEPPQRRVTP